MKKLLIAALLILAVVFTVVACTDEPIVEETTDSANVETPTTEEPSQDATEEPSQDATEEPSQEPDTPAPVTTEEPDTPAPVTTEEPETLPYKTPAEAGQIAASFDTFYVNGAMYFEADGGAGDKLDGINNTIVFKTGAKHDSMVLRGWIGFGQAIDSFGYYIDGYNFVYGSFAAATEDAVKGAGGEHASRFEILVPLADLDAGDHNVGFIVKLADGTVVLLRTEITVTIEKNGWSGSGIVTHQSFDQFYKGTGNAENGDQNFFTPGAAANWDFVATLPDFTVTELTYWGWLGLMGEIGQFGYQLNGGAIVYDDAWTIEAEGPVLNAAQGGGAETACRMKLTINIAGLEGENLLTVYYKNAEGEVVVLNDITIVLPVKPKDITDTFVSDVNSNEIGTSHASSDLANFFTIELPLGGAQVEAYGEGKVYHQSSISSFYADVNGLYFLKANIVASDNNAWTFVRGYKVVNSDEVIEKFDPNAGIYKINNYYETDGSMMAGAGIFARVDGTNLYLMIKYYNADAITRVGNKMITIPAAGTELTMADDGEVVTIMVDGVTYVTIALNGSVVYDDINEVLPKNGFAASAVITYADGTSETIENTLIADTCECQVGVVARAGSIKFTSIEVGAYSSIEVPGFISDQISKTITSTPSAEVGTLLSDTDLASFFLVELPLGGSSVEAFGDGKAYNMTSISDMYAGVDGKYVFSLNNVESNPNGYMFVRGYHQVVSDFVAANFDPAAGIFKINNYYETDGLASFGGAGIYFRIGDGKLYVMVKSHNAMLNCSVYTSIYEVALDTDSTVITVTDDDNVVTAYVGDKVYATITLSGEITYDNIKAENCSPSNVFAASADIVLADGQTYTLQNTLIAAHIENSEIGVVARSGVFKFTDLKVDQLKNFEVPGATDEPEVPVVEDYNVPMDQWVVTGHKAGITPAGDATHGGMVAAGGLENGALLHQGYIGVGEIDLSKYSKVIVYCGCDASAVTQGHYDANANNRIILTSADASMTNSPSDEIIIAATTYTLHGWTPAAVEIDLTGIDYNGPVFITYDTLPGTFMLVSAIEFIA